MANVTREGLVSAGVNPKYAPEIARHIGTLDPSVQDRYAQTVIQFYKEHGDAGYDITINQSNRSTAEQARLNRSGITAAAPRNSWHTAAAAADFTVLKNGKADDGKRGDNAYGALLAPIAQQHGLHNPIRNDVGHFQPVEVPSARRGRALSAFVAGVPAQAMAAADVPMPRLRPSTAQAPVQMASLGSTVPMPNLRPTGAGQFAVADPFSPPSAAAYAAKPASNTAPFEALFSVPNQPAADTNPAQRVSYAVPAAGAGAMGSDAVIRAALSGDPTAFGKAVGGLLMGQGVNPKAIQQYFTDFAKAQPALAKQVSANLAGNAGFMNAIPAMFRGSVQDAMAAPTGPLPGGQVPTPRLRPAIAQTTPTAAPRPAGTPSSAYVAAMSQYVPATKPTTSTNVPLPNLKPRATASAAPPASSSSYTPFTPRPQANPVATVANAVKSGLGTVASMASGLFGGKPATSSPTTTSYTPFTPAPMRTSYTPFIPAPAPPPPAPKPKPVVATAKYVSPVYRMQTYSPAQRQPSLITNPKYTEWQEYTQANPELRAILKAPSQFIQGPTPAPVMVAQQPTMRATPANLMIAPKPAATGSSAPKPTATAAQPTSSHYTSATTQSGVTVGRNSAGQTSFVSGPSGTYSVNPSAGTYTSLSTGKTFSL